MQVIVNGQTKEFEPSISLHEVITSLQIEDKVMAAAVNMEIVKKDSWSTHRLNENDKVELLQFVGGG